MREVPGVKVRKQDGRLQEFDREKLQLSLEKAGASRVDAINTAFRIGARVREGTTTAEIRNAVTTELMALSHAAAQSYNAQKQRIVARRVSRNRH